MEPSGPFCTSINSTTSSTSTTSHYSNDLSPNLVPTHFLYLPPGLGLTLSSSNASNNTGRDDFQLNTNISRPGMNSSPFLLRKSQSQQQQQVEHEDLSNTSSSSRKGSSSSSRSNLSFTSSSSSTTSSTKTTNTTNSSIESSSRNNNNNNNNNRALKDSGEDQELYNARRALWDECIQVGSLEFGEDRQAVSSTTLIFNNHTPIDSEIEAGETEEEEEEEYNDDDQEEDDDIEKLELTPPSPLISKPSHATLSPHSSCLRLPSLSSSSTSTSITNFTTSQSNSTFFSSSSSNSNSRSSSSSFLHPSSPSSSITSLLSTSTTTTSNSTSPSVQFSSDPPIAVETYSPEEYERGGDPPLEKLSMRDCIELHRLRECVGLWSGKIKKWEGIEGYTGVGRGGEGEGENGEVMGSPVSFSNSLSLSGSFMLEGGGNSTSTTKNERGRGKMDSYCCPSGVTGVVTLCHSDS